MEHSELVGPIAASSRGHRHMSRREILDAAMQQQQSRMGQSQLVSTAQSTRNRSQHSTVLRHVALCRTALHRTGLQHLLYCPAGFLFPFLPNVLNQTVLRLVALCCTVPDSDKFLKSALLSKLSAVVLGLQQLLIFVGCGRLTTANSIKTNLVTIGGPLARLQVRRSLLAPLLPPAAPAACSPGTAVCYCCLLISF